jgi:hypothetical protein
VPFGIQNLAESLFRYFFGWSFGYFFGVIIPSHSRAVFQATQGP